MFLRTWIYLAFFCLVSHVLGNDKVLFLTNSESGLGNVFLATTHAMVLNHPEVEIHFASFANFQKPFSRISSIAQKVSPQSSPSKFHTLPPPSFTEAFRRYGNLLEVSLAAPGIPGLPTFLASMEAVFNPWTGEDYVALYSHIVQLIEEVNPDVIVLDSLFSPGMTATRALGRKHMMLSATALKDQFAIKQSWGAGFWKYPAMGSGYTFPVPWANIPGNMWILLRTFYALIRGPSLSAKKAYINSQGLPDPIYLFTVYRADIPWIVPSLPETEYPLTLAANANITATGPITLCLEPVEKQDPELAEWLAKAPTVLLNLGSLYDYDKPMASNMAQALSTILTQHPKIQILWKLNKRHDKPFPDSVFQHPLHDHLQTNRIRITNWISADPASLLETGHIILSVHHGGANSFYEALASGVPAVILPMWADCFDLAVRAEWLGIGIWGSRGSAPAPTVKDLEGAMLEALGEGSRARGMRDRVRELAEGMKGVQGRDLAAKAIVEFMRGSYAGNVGRKDRGGHEEL